MSELQISPLDLKADYRKKWNANEKDFVCLTRNGELVSNSIYRVGGFNADVKADYFMVLKYVEVYYPKSITDRTGSDPKHLEGRWCIIDKNGIEKVEFDSFKTPYPVKNSCIYSIDNKYYNIESGEFYCSSYSKIESTDFLFLDNAYDKDESKRGVIKINKKNGTWELFP